jgi:hypothetical protein
MSTPEEKSMRQLHLAFSTVAAVLIGSAMVAAPLAAQTRESEIARQQEEKERVAAADTPNRAETFFQQFEKGKWFVGVPRGWYPVFGSVYPGSGFAPGVGYRRHIGYDSYVDASAMYSITHYKKVQVAASTPNHARHRLDFAGLASWIDAPQVPFFGLGNESTIDGRTNFRIQRARMEGSVVLHSIDALRLRLGGGFDNYTQKSGQGASPSTEQVYSPAAAPLLGSDDGLYLRGEASAAVQWLQSPAYSRTGGLYRLAYEEFNPQRGNGGTFGFVRTELVQHVPVHRETWVLSLRARTESVVRKSDVVPYFLMPYLGSGDTLRAYATGRFRDRHTLLLTGELRWFPSRLAVDMALFFDAGKVAPARSQLTFDRMNTDYGLGIRFHTPSATALRVDLARGSEGWRLVLAASPAF